MNLACFSISNYFLKAYSRKRASHGSRLKFVANARDVEDARFTMCALPRALEVRAAANVLSSGFLEKAGLEK